MKQLLKFLAFALAFAASTAAYAQNTTLTNHAFAIGKGPGVSGFTSLLCTSAQLAVGQAAADPICKTVTGDWTLSAAGVATLATVNANVGSFGSAASCVSVTSNAKGLTTAISAATCTPAIGSITGLGTGVATALGVSVGTAGAPVVNGGVLGTPSSGVATNLTGTASGLTAGTVTTNANLTGDVTSVGNATTLTNAPVIAKVLTGYVSGAGTVAATDTILGAIQKLNGNIATKQATLTAGQLPGTATSDNASAGNVGEYISSTVLSGSAVPLTTNVSVNVTSISLTAGDWDVEFIAQFNGAGTTTVNNQYASISTATGALNSAPGNINAQVQTSAAYNLTGFGVTVPVGLLRMSLSATTTVFGVVQSSFGASTSNAYGILRARRIR